MRTKVVNEKYYAETYSDVDIKKLCSIGEIIPEDLGDFRDTLEDIAAIYRWESAKHENLPSSSNIKRELQTVSKQANRLLASLDGLSWDAQRKINSRADLDSHKGITGESSGSDEPSLVISLSEFNTDIQSVIVDVPTLRSLLGGLVNASDAGMIDLPKGRPGKSRSWGLRLWMINIESLWLRTSDQPFTRDTASQNDPITNAARFCVAALQMINPDCPSSLVMTEMKECIKSSNRRTG